MIKYYIFLFIFSYSVSQNLIFDDNLNKYTIKFQLINNLIVLKAELNGQKNLNFILDSGSKSTILLEVHEEDSLFLKNSESITVNGLGSGESILALKSIGNNLKIGKLINDSLDIIAILNNDLNYSQKFGFKINGILGFDTFKKYIVEINYISKSITFYRREYFYKKQYKKLKKYASFPLTIYTSKPFIDINYYNSEEYIPIHMLIDTGNSDAFWLFPNKEKNIFLTKNYFRDNLGFGLNGPIMGNRAKVNNFKIGNHVINNPTVSFPDSLDIINVTSYKNRNGSFGGGALSRFHLIFDVEDKKIFLKPNNNINNPFHYDLSGINLYQPYLGIPIYLIYSLREGSLGEKNGFLKDDVLISINGNSTLNLKLYQIYEILHNLEGKKVSITIERNGQKITKSFYLKQDFIE